MTGRPIYLARTLHAMAMLAAVIAGLAFLAHPARTQEGWAPGVTITTPPGDGWATESQREPEPPPADSNTDPNATELQGGSDAIRRAREALSAGDVSGVAVSAKLTEDGRVLTGGLVWRVFSDPKDPEAKPDLVVSRQHHAPRFRLEPGSYLVNVSFGRSHITRRVEVEAGPMKMETFVLNAGGLRMTAYAGDEKVSPNSVSYDVYEGEASQSGQRRLILPKARPGVIVRLNAGIYFIRSTYGGANANVEAEVSVEAGKLTEMSVSHTAGKVTLGLVTRPGGEALPATQWTISTTDGDVVDRSVGALPTHILAPGTYKVTANNAGRTFDQEFTIENNQAARVEILAQ